MLQAFAASKGAMCADSPCDSEQEFANAFGLLPTHADKKHERSYKIRHCLRSLFERPSGIAVWIMAVVPKTILPLQ